MRTRTVTERIGENMGPIPFDAIDWSEVWGDRYPNVTGEARAAMIAEQVGWFRTIAEILARGGKVECSNYGGCPRIWSRVVDIGMYDGWPYWKPVPSVQFASVYSNGGGDWCAFGNLTAAPRECVPAPERGTP